MWLSVLISCALLQIYACNEKLPIPDDDQLDLTMCDLEACQCLHHDTHIIYKNGDNVPVDISCDCSHSTLKKMHLLSPPPVPNKTMRVHITRCEEVTVTPIDLKYTSPSWTHPESFVITDVDKVIVVPGGGFWANYILIRNVSHIPELPHGVLTFASFPDRPIGAFFMEYTTIDTIKEGAFANVHVMETFQLNNVKIKTIEEHAFSVVINQQKGEFKIVNSTIESIFSSGIGVSSQFVTFHNNIIKLIDSFAIRVITEKFTFSNCSVSSITKAYAFDVQTRVVAIIHNYFGYLETAAFVGIRKAEMFRSAKSGINSNWLFAFANNRIKIAERDSLHCNWTRGSKDIIHENIFEDCKCPTMTWMLYAEHGEAESIVKVSFYSAILDPNNHNVCEFEECPQIPIYEILEYLASVHNESSNQCPGNSTNVDFCKYFYAFQSSAFSANNSMYPVVFSIVFALLMIL